MAQDEQIAGLAQDDKYQSVVEEGQTRKAFALFYFAVMASRNKKKHRSKDRPLQQQERWNYFWVELVRARKTRSSTGTLRVKMVGTAALATPTACAELEIAGPAGLLCSEVLSPGMTEIRVVLGAQEVVVPKQVSRTKIWR